MIISTHSGFYLLVAIVFGVLGTVSMKMSHGFQRLRPSLFLVLFYAVSFVALTLAVQSVDVSIIYAIWSGIGTLLVAILSVFLFQEYFSPQKMLALLCIIVGVVGIHLTHAIH
jgi:small multidrug resistance pump